eukprot:242679_1
MAQTNKDKEQYPILKKHGSAKPSLHNAMNWCVAFGHSISTMGLLLSYHGAFQGGQEFWDKYKSHRRIFLFSGIGCGILSALLEKFKWEKKLKILDCADRYPFVMWPPRIMHSVAIPSFIIYVEFFGGVKQSRHGMLALLFQYINAKFTNKFAMGYLSSYFEQAKRENVELRKKLT